MKSFQPFFTPLKLILSCSLIFQSYAFSKVPADVLDTKMKAYQVLKKRVKFSDGDSLVGGDKPSSYLNLEYDLPLMASPRIVDVNEFNIFGIQVWNEGFDINFDKDFYRRADFQQIFKSSKQNNSKARDIILAAFSLEYISYLMNNDVRFNQKDYNNPIPEFRRYNKYVIYIVTHIYNLWKTSHNYHSFLNRFYKSLPGKVFGSTSKTNNTLKAHDNPRKHSCSKNCVKDWPSTKGKYMSVKPLIKKRDSLDKDNGWWNPFDWFEMHDQEKINILNYEILEQDIIHNIVEGIHTIHENKNKLMRNWIRTGDLEFYEWVVNFTIIAIAVAAPSLVAEGWAWAITLQGITVLEGDTVGGGGGGEIVVVKEDGETYVITEGGKIVTEGGGTQVAMNPGLALGILGACVTIATFVSNCQERNENKRHRQERLEREDRHRQERLEREDRHRQEDQKREDRHRQEDRKWEDRRHQERLENQNRRHQEMMKRKRD